MRIAILDDYQNVATRFADWDSLDADVVVFTKPFSGADDVVRSLAGFDVLVAMRERTHFPAEVLEKLTDVRLTPPSMWPPRAGSESRCAQPDMCPTPPSSTPGR
jgi:hypothetical protein